MLYNAELFWLAARVEADLAELGRSAGDSETVEDCGRAAAAVVDALRDAITARAGSRPPPEAVAFHRLARAELARVRAERDSKPWTAAAEAFAAIGHSTSAAYAEFRAAEALALSGARVPEIAVPLKAAHPTAVTAGSPRP